MLRATLPCPHCAQLRPHGLIQLQDGVQARCLDCGAVQILPAYSPNGPAERPQPIKADAL